MSNTDKLNRLLANIIEFNSGERLTADKLNALVAILDENLSHISGAIGDIYDENYNAAHRSEGGKQFASNTAVDGAEKRRFDIANLARLIGPASNLNPQAVNATSITETIPSGTLEHTLEHPIVGAGSIPGYTDFNSDFTSETQYKIIDDRKILFSKPLSEERTITYVTAPHLKGGGPNCQGARFNVYPDPNQVDEKLTIQYVPPANGASSPTYTITLPTIARQQISLADEATSELDNRDINHGQQLLLPEWICDLGPDTDLPSYSLYLKNYTTNESYVDATYTKVDDQTILVTNLNIGDQNCVNGFDLRIVTVGTDITTSIDDLRNKMYLHSHDGSFGEPPVHIKTLAGIFEGDAPSGVYGPAAEDWNPLPNYLHRDGWRSDNRDINGDNAMRGNLLMGLESFDPISSKSINSSGGSSHAIMFGGNNTKIHRDNSDLSLKNEGNQINLTAATINSIATDAVTINTDSFVVEVDATSSTFSLFRDYTTDNFVTSNVVHQTNEKDLRIVDEKSKLVKVSKNEVELRVFPETDFTFTPALNEGDDTYIDLLRVIESLNSENNWYNFDASLGLGTWHNTDPQVEKTLIETFWDMTPETSNIELTSFLIRDTYYKLFAFAENTNESYNFKLYKAYDSGRIYSPTYRFIGDPVQRNLRQFQLHIDRGATLYLNYNGSILKSGYKYEHEFVVSIDQLFMGGGTWNGAPTVRLDYYGTENQSFAELNAYGKNVGDEAKMASLGITDIVVSTMPTEVINNENINEGMTKVVDGSVVIQIGQNISIGENDNYGVIFFDKLLVKEHIYNNTLFVEVRGFKGDHSGGTSDHLFGKYKTPEVPVS